jgi:hypothetical protein
MPGSKEADPANSQFEEPVWDEKDDGILMEWADLKAGVKAKEGYPIHMTIWGFKNLHDAQIFTEKCLKMRMNDLSREAEMAGPDHISTPTFPRRPDVTGPCFPSMEPGYHHEAKNVEHRITEPDPRGE